MNVRCPHCNENIEVDEEGLRLQTTNLVFGYQDAKGFREWLESALRSPVVNKEDKC